MPALWAYGQSRKRNLQKKYSHTATNLKTFYWLLFLSIFTTTAGFFADAEEVLFEKVRCAGQSIEEDTCLSGLCFDSINIRHDFVETGCATSEQCESAGCFLKKDKDEFTCCCAHPYCNGKSHRMVKARWRMFQNGDYLQNDRSMSPRLSPRNVKILETNGTVTPNGVTAKVTAQIQTIQSTSQAPSTTKINSIEVRRNHTATTENSQPNRLKTQKMANQKSSTNKSDQAPTSRMPVIATTRKPSTEKASSNKSSQPIQVKYMLPTTAADLPEYVTTTDKPTSTSSSSASTIISTTSETNTISTPTSRLPTTIQTTTIKKNVEDLTTKLTKEHNSNHLIPARQTNDKTISSSTTTSTTSTTLTSINPITTSNAPKTTAFQQSTMTTVEKFTSTDDALSAKRTTRSSVTGFGVAAQPTFPWYWVCLAGFGCAVAVFLCVLLCLRRCGYGRVRRGSGPLETSEDRNEGDFIIDAESPTKKDPQVSKKRKVKRKAENHNQQLIKSDNKPIPNGVTHESLASRITAITTASGGGKMDEDEEEFGAGGGQELTVIDPLLNKAYSGTVHESPTKKMTTTKY